MFTAVIFPATTTAEPRLRQNACDGGVKATVPRPFPSVKPPPAKSDRELAALVDPTTAPVPVPQLEPVPYDMPTLLTLCAIKNMEHT